MLRLSLCLSTTPSFPSTNLDSQLYSQCFAIARGGVTQSAMHIGVSYMLSAVDPSITKENSTMEVRSISPAEYLLESVNIKHLSILNASG